MCFNVNVDKRTYVAEKFDNFEVMSKNETILKNMYALQLNAKR